MKRFLAGLILVMALCASASAQTLVRIQDGAVRYADGSLACGQIDITWPAFTSSDGVTIVGNRKTVRIENGAVDFYLTANTGASPTGTSYTARYRLCTGATLNETWIVPASGPVAINDIRTPTVPTPGLTINTLTQVYNSSIVLGDLLVGTAAGYLSRLAVGTSGYCLTSTGTTVAWASCSSSGVITTLNGLTGATQTFAAGTSGTDFAISSSGTTHTFNIPDAGAAARGLVTTGTQTLAGAKTFSSAPTFSTMTAESVLFAGTGGLLSQDNANFYRDTTDATNRYGLFIGSVSGATNNYALRTNTGLVKIGERMHLGGGTFNAINTAIPLHVNVDAVTNPALLLDSYDPTEPGISLQGRSARGTSASPTATQSGDTLSSLSGRGYASDGFSTISAEVGIILRAAENFTAIARGTAIGIIATPIGSVTRAEVVTISGVGVVTLTNTLTAAEEGVDLTANAGAIVHSTGYGFHGDSTSETMRVTQNGVTTDVNYALQSLLGAQHTDTCIQAIARGDTLAVNSSGFWCNVVKGSQYTVWTMGANDPGWGTVALDQTAATSGALLVARGGNGAAPGADDQVMVSDSTSAGTFRTLPNGAVSYATASNTFSQANCASLSDESAMCASASGANLTSGSVTATQLGTDSVSSDELNATGVEAELEAVLDLDALQGQIGDGQIADAAVDGGTGGEIADNTVTAADIDETVAYALSSISNTFVGASYTGPTADPADTGILRASNDEKAVCWEAAAAGTDVCMQADASEVIQLTGGTLDAGDLSGTVAATIVAPTPLPTPGTSITLAAPRGYGFCSGGACAVALPVPAAGYEFCIRNADNQTNVITLTNIASIQFEATARTSYYAANRKLVSGGAVTDQICLVGYDATHYAVMSFTGTWTDTAP